MKRFFKKLFFGIFIFVIIFITAITACAHSGRTDSSGGHRDNKNKSGLGSYHYHCGGYPAHLHKNGYCPYRDIFPSSVSIKSEKTTLKKGEKVSISASVYPENSCNTNVTWSSSDTSIVSVSSGTLVAKNYGTATITAETFNGKKKSVKITVKEIVAQKVTISKDTQTSEFYIGDELQLKATITPENVDNSAIVWESGDNSIATVSTSGGVKLLSEGKVEIRATASNGVVGKFTIHVKEKYVDTVNINDDTLNLLLGDEQNIAVTVSPADATFPDLIWESKDPSIASVSAEGKIVALACGQTSITATSSNGISDSITVNISEIVAESLKIECPTSLMIGDSVVLKACFTPDNTTVQTIQWSVSDNSIADVTDEGCLVTKGVGTVIITALQKDVSATYELEVLPIKVKSVEITSSTGETIAPGKKSTFNAKVLPTNATYPNIIWSTSDSEIAVIDSNGVLSALKGGTVNVIATTEDGFQAEYTLVIISPVVVALTIIVLAGIITTVILLFKRKKK